MVINFNIWFKRTLIIITSLIIVGCSVVTLGYNRLPLLTILELNSIFDLTDEQEKFSRIQLDAWLEWHCDVVEALVRGGADVNKSKNDGATPINMASCNGHCGVVEALVRAGADLTLAWHGQTPLFSATTMGHTDVVRVLQAAAVAEAGRSLQCPPRH